MEKKANDLMMNIVANPDFTIQDFATIGFNIDNTSLQDKNIYRDHPSVQKYFSNDEGKFDEQKFNATYNRALQDYQQMSEEDFFTKQEKQAIYHRDNFDAPVEEMQLGPYFRQIVIPNPERLQYGTTRLGQVSERTKSVDELAQENRVLLNPTEVYQNGDADWSKAQWGKDAHNGFFDYFTDTLVMAQWDEDGVHKDPVTGQEQTHKKGDLKIGADGSYFYEKLDGRDIYGRRVLNKMNVLTEDGSALNKYDFFDSDDINQKSAIGSVMKNAALVGTMFLPYVGPVVAGLSIATQLAGLGATLGKMLIGSDSPTLSAIEGWSRSVSRQGAQTEYAQNNTWCWENFINLIGDVVGQLKEQRFIFEKIPALATGKYVGSKEAYEAELKTLTEGYKKNAQDMVESLVQAGDAQAVTAAQELLKTAPLRAQMQMDSFMKGYHKIGEILSKGYMTAVTVGDTYGEAKAAGASDLDATLLTLGYAAGEYAILNTRLGEWILPELRGNEYKNKAIINTLAGLKEETQNIVAGFRQGMQKLPGEARKEYAKRVFKLGRDIANATYVNGSRKGKDLLTASLAAGAGEGFEEVSEELLADFSKGCYNAVNWLRGENTRLDSFGFTWKDGVREWSGKEVFDRYSMSLIGGAVGGSLTNLGTTYNMINDLSKMDHRKAIQEVIYMARNGQLDELRKQISKMDLDNKHMSFYNYEDTGDKVVPKPGTAQDNRDTILKKALNDQLDFIQNILEAEGINVPDGHFIDKQILGELRFNALYNSTTAGRFMNEFNTLSTELVQLVASANNLLDTVADTNKDGNVSDKESRRSRLSDEQKTELSKIEKKIKETRQQLKDLVEGKRADEFIGDALYEMSTAISGNDVPVTFPLWLKANKITNFDSLDVEQQNKLKKKYKIWKESEGRDDIHLAASAFREMITLASDNIKNFEQVYLNQNQDIKEIDSLVRELYQFDVDSDEQFLSVAANKNKYILLAKEFASRLGIQGIDQMLTQLQTDEKAIRDSTLLTDQEKEAQLKTVQNAFRRSLKTLIGDNIKTYIDKFVQQGFANQETKEQLKRLVQYSKEQFLAEVNSLSNISEGIFDDTERQALEEKIGQLLDKYNLLDQDYIKIIDDLANTPHEEALNQFAISIGKDPINLTQLITTVNKILAENSENLTGFTLSSNLAQTLNNAIETIELYQRAIFGTRTDAFSVNNLYGYSATLNEVAKKMGKDVNLAEIDANYADILHEDLNTDKNKLIFLRDLYTVNRGQTLSKQDRVGARAYSLFYSKVKIFIDIPDDDPLKQNPAFLNLEQVVNSLTLLDDLATGKKGLTLSDQDKVTLQEQEIKLREAIYDFFNSGIIDDQNTLARLLNPDKLGLYDQADDILNEDLEEIDGNAFVWWLASSAAVKASDFYAKYKSTLDPKSKILPIPTQEIAIYHNYAGIVNGDVYTKFYNSLKEAFRVNWEKKSPEDRLPLLNKIGKSEFVDKSWDKYISLFLPIPKYQNILLTEGIPGSGKTKAVIAAVVKMLKATDPKIVSNVWSVHCADIKGNSDSQAKTLHESIGVEGGKYFDPITFLETISPEYKQYPIVDGVQQIPDTAYKFNAENELRSVAPISESIEGVPSLIIIDESTKLTALELDIIDDYAKRHGITVIIAGDYDQNGVTGSHKLSVNGVTGDLTISTNRTDFPRSPKLGVSMRTDNVLLSDDLVFFQKWKYNTNQDLTLKYFEDETGLYGIKREYNTDINSVMESIQKLVDSLTDDEKAKGKIIGFIGHKGSALEDKLKKNATLSKYIDFTEGDSAQGKEGRYYIIEPNPTDNYKTENWLRRVYTGISRAQQGAIVVLDPTIPIYSEPATEKIDSVISEEGKKKYTEGRLKVLDAVSLGDGNIQYKERTKEGSSNGNSKKLPVPPVTPPSDPDGPPPIIPPVGIFDEAPLGSKENPFIRTKEKQRELWGPLMDISEVKIELDNREAVLPLVDIQHTYSIEHNGQEVFITGKYNVIDYNDRKIVLVKIGNHIQPFYCSTGLAGKSTPHTWQPFFGLGSMPKDYGGPSLGWLNKTSEDDIRNFYGEPLLKAIGAKLDELFGTELRDVNLGPNMLYDYSDADWLQQVNTSFPDPDNYDNRGTNVYDNVARAKQAINEEWNRISKLIAVPVNKSDIIDSIKNTNTKQELEDIINNIEDTLKNDTDILDAYNTRLRELSQEPPTEEPTQDDTPTPIKVGDFLTETIGDTSTVFEVMNISDEGIVTLRNIQTDATQQEDLEIIKAQLGQSYKITSKEELQHPLENENDEIPQVTNEEEYQANLDDLNEDEVLPPVTIEQDKYDEPFSLHMLLHSFNTFEAGITWDKVTGEITSDPRRMAARIDSINGFKQIESLFGKQLRGFTQERLSTAKGRLDQIQYYLNLIGSMRKILLNVPEKADIIKRISQLLKLNYPGLDIPNLQVRFAMKTSPNIGPSTINSNKDYVSTYPDAYGNSKRETLQYHYSTAPNSQCVQSKKIVAIFGTEANGDFLEIPLQSPTSAYTYITATNANGEPIFPELYNVFIEALAVMPKYKALEEVLKVCRRNPIYKNVGKYIEFYRFTFNGLFEFPSDWTPAGNLEAKGIQFVQSAGESYIDEDGYTYDANDIPPSEWITLDQFSKDPEYYVTKKILVARNGYIQVGPNRVKVVNTGHPFVLIASDPDLKSDSDLANYFIRQFKEPNLEKKVKLMYVMMPTASFQEYIQHLEQLLFTQKSKRRDLSKDIGQLFTPYQIFRTLLSDRRGIQLIQDYLPSSDNEIIAQLQDWFEEINKAYDEKNYSKVKNALLSTVTLGGPPTKLITLLGQLLTNIAYNKSSQIDFYGVQYKDLQLHQGNVDTIQKVLTDAKFQIYHHPQISEQSQAIGMFQAIDNQGSEYTVDGKSVKIHGKVNQMVYEITLDDYINIWMSPANVTDEDRYHNKRYITTDEEEHKLLLYTKAGYRPIRKTQSEPPKISAFGEKYIKVLDKLLTLNLAVTPGTPNLNTMKQSSLTAELLKISHQLNTRFPKLLATVVGDDLLISQDSRVPEGTKEIHDADGLRPSSLLPGRKYQLEVTSEGIKTRYTLEYEALPDGSSQIHLVPEVTPTVQQQLPIISEEDFQIFSSLFDTIKQTAKDRRLWQLLDSTSAEQFNIGLASLKHCWNGTNNLRISKLSQLRDSTSDNNLKRLVDIIIAYENDHNPLKPKENDTEYCVPTITIKMK